MNISSEVKSLREFLDSTDLSVRDAAHAMGLHRDTIYSWFRKGAVPKPENIAQIRSFVVGSKSSKSETVSSASAAPKKATSPAPSKSTRALLNEAKQLTSRLHEIYSILEYNS